VSSCAAQLASTGNATAMLHGFPLRAALLEWMTTLCISRIAADDSFSFKVISVFFHARMRASMAEDMLVVDCDTGEADWARWEPRKS